MRDIRSILILFLLLPAISLGQTIHMKKNEIVYEGKLEVNGDSYNHAKSLLLNFTNADSIKEEKDNKKLSSMVKVKLPSTYAVQKYLSYQVNLHPASGIIEYQIKDVQLTLHERSKKPRILSSEQLLKGMDESGNTSRDAEKILDDIDMYIQQFIARMKTTGY